MSERRCDECGGRIVNTREGYAVCEVCGRVYSRQFDAGRSVRKQAEPNPKRGMTQYSSLDFYKKDLTSKKWIDLQRHEMSHLDTLTGRRLRNENLAITMFNHLNAKFIPFDFEYLMKFWVIEFNKFSKASILRNGAKLAKMIYYLELRKTMPMLPSLKDMEIYGLPELQPYARYFLRKGYTKRISIQDQLELYLRKLFDIFEVDLSLFPQTLKFANTIKTGESPKTKAAIAFYITFPKITTRQNLIKLGFGIGHSPTLAKYMQKRGMEHTTFKEISKKPEIKKILSSDKDIIDEYFSSDWRMKR